MLFFLKDKNHKTFWHMRVSLYHIHVIYYKLIKISKKKFLNFKLKKKFCRRYLCKVTTFPFYFPIKSITIWLRLITFKIRIISVLSSLVCYSFLFFFFLEIYSLLTTSSLLVIYNSLIIKTIMSFFEIKLPFEKVKIFLVLNSKDFFLLFKKWN